MIYQILVLLFFSLTAHNKNFIISEVYGNAPAKGSDSGKEWIEIYKAGEGQINIKSLRLDIFLDREPKPIFSNTKLFTPNLVFGDALIIAQDENLGFDRCIAPDLLKVIFPHFKLYNNKSLKICVEINEDERDCVRLLKRDEMIDGVSLFRESFDLAEHPIWFKEPCHLFEKVFATPWQPAKACVAKNELPKEIFFDCSHENGQKRLFFEPISENVGKQPLVIVDALTKIGHKKFKATLLPKDSHIDVGLMATCLAPKESLKVCNKIRQDEIFNGAMDLVFSIPSYFDAMRDKIFFRFTSLYDQRQDIEIPQKSLLQLIGKEPAFCPALKIDKPDDNQERLFLKFNLEKKFVPVNLRLIRQPDDVLMMQRAFVSPGIKELTLDGYKNQIIELIFSSINGKYAAVLREGKIKLDPC